MKKSLLFTLIVFIISLNVDAQNSLPFNDDFESYNVGDDISSVGPYVVVKTESATVTAANDASDGKFVTMMPGTENGMVFKIKVGPAFGGIISGDYEFSASINPIDGKKVMIKIWGNSGFTITEQGQVTGTGWQNATTKFTVDVGNDTVYNIIPVLYSYNPQEILIDNISIVNLTTGVTVFSQDFSTINVPNPSNGIFSIKSDKKIVEYSVINAVGQVVKTVTGLNNKEVKIDMTGAADGVYMIRVKDTDNNVKVLKQVIR